jgi:hypothetical protein
MIDVDDGVDSSCAYCTVLTLVVVDVRCRVHELSPKLRAHEKSHLYSQDCIHFRAARPFLPVPFALRLRLVRTRRSAGAAYSLCVCVCVAT